MAVSYLGVYSGAKKYRMNVDSPLMGLFLFLRARLLLVKLLIWPRPGASVSDLLIGVRYIIRRISMKRDVWCTPPPPPSHLFSTSHKNFKGSYWNNRSLELILYTINSKYAKKIHNVTFHVLQPTAWALPHAKSWIRSHIQSHGLYTTLF